MMNNRAPVIGITTYSRNASNQYYLPATYVDSVRAAGGFPILLPPGEQDLTQLLDLVDGVIFSGGGDIDVSFYGGQGHSTLYSIDLERDRFEIDLAHLLFERELPVLGICRGQQLLAVASGGDLISHLPDEVGEDVPHWLEGATTVEHPVEIEEASQLAGIMGVTTVQVPSWHHQAARGEPPGWRVVGRSPDGAVEAMERVDHPWMIAVQWHPERAPDHPAHRRIFDSLVAAARARQR